MIAARLALRASRVAARSFRPAQVPARTFRPLQHHRFASYERFPGRGGPHYGRIGRVQYIWANYQTIILVTGAAGGTFYFLNQEEVPITHRRRFNCISPETEKKIMGNAGYEQILQEFRGKLLPENHPYTQMVARVVERLLPSTGGLAGDDWAVHVIDAPKEKNAFVIPGGKVFVFSGILPICQDENGLAAVLGHEIAHNVAHHAAERLSRSAFVLLIALATASLFDISGSSSKFIVDLFLSLPNSRVQEAEADRIGLLMMAESCYDPNGAVEMWRRMAEAEKGAPPQFLSTHPSSHNRMDTIRGWLPEAMEKLESSECGITRGYANEFKKAFNGQQSNFIRQTLPSPQQSRDDDFW